MVSKIHLKVYEMLPVNNKKVSCLDIQHARSEVAPNILPILKDKLDKKTFVALSFKSGEEIP